MRFYGKIKNYFLIFVGTLYFFCPSFSVEAGTIRINPTKLRLVIAPGMSKDGVIEVENSTEDALTIKAYVQDWRYAPLQNGTKEFFPAGSTELSSTSWITFSPSDFTIPPFGRQNVSYVVSVPENAEAGRYAVLFFETLMQKPDQKDSSSVGLVVRIGALFYVEPEGRIRREAEVTGLTVVRSSQRDPLRIGLGLKNSGNVDLKTAGTFHVMDQEGMIFARGEFDDSYTFPGDAAKLSGVWTEPLAAGSYDLVLTIDIGKASEEAGLERGPVITKDASLEIGDDGSVLKVGELR